MSAAESLASQAKQRVQSGASGPTYMEGGIALAVLSLGERVADLAEQLAGQTKPVEEPTFNVAVVEFIDKWFTGVPPGADPLVILATEAVVSRGKRDTGFMGPGILTAVMEQVQAYAEGFVDADGDEPDNPEPDNPEQYKYLGGQQPHRVDMLGMFTPEGTTVVARAIEIAMDGGSVADIRQIISDAEAAGHSEITDTAVRDELIGNLPAGSPAQAAMTEALECSWVTDDFGTRDEDQTRAILQAARTINS